jgi:two-component system cell cycle sensor histidine kinase/response regulator CckA
MAALALDSRETIPRIMIVEGEGIIAGRLAARLEKMGYEVAGAFGSSEEALENIPRLRPDLILMDIRIKGALDGIDMAAQVRETFDIPVIYLTAHADRETVDRAKTTGAFGVLTKPLQQESLATSIELALQNHKSERHIRQQRAWLETILNTMGDAVVVTDSTGNLQFLNRAGEELTGWTNVAARGKPVASVLPSVDFEARFRADGVAERLPGGTQQNLLSGRQFQLEGEIAASLDRGRVVGWVLTIRDATSRQKAERKRRQAEKMQAVGVLAAGIARDFNHLLYVVWEYAEQLLISEDVKGEAASGLTEIRKAAQTALSVSRQLTQYGRSGTNEPQDIDLNQLIRATQELWRRLAGGSVMWETKLDPTIGTIRADPGQMKQVLMNLIANARDAMPQGGVLTIETVNTTGAALLLIVRDTGVGMSAETVERIFEPYFTTKGGGSGTGLGLSIVHRVISDLGGAISVESEIGKGSVFTIRLPRNSTV